MLGCSGVMISLLVDSLNHFYLALTNPASKSILFNILQRRQKYLGTKCFKISKFSDTQPGKNNLSIHE